MPPGKRQLMPMIAMGSSSEVGTATGAAGAVVSGSEPKRRVFRCCARRMTSGWSKTRVVGSFSPVAVRSALRSSTASNESKPRSRNGRSSSTVCAVGCPRTSAVCVRTRSRRAFSRSSTASGWSRSRREFPSPVSSPSSASRTARTSGMASSSGRGRAAVNAGVKASQSTSPMARNSSSSANACRSPATAVRGFMNDSPRQLRDPVSMLPPRPSSADHRPQAMVVPARPRARRLRVTESR